MYHAHHSRHPLNRGFSLLEVLLFVSLAAVLLGAVTVLLSLLLQSRTKQQSMIEVEEQSRRAVEVITSSIQSARSITAPAVGTSAGSLSVTGATTSRIEASDNRLWLTVGTDAPLPVTSSEIVVSNLQFTNVSRSQTPGAVRLQFTVAYRNPEGRNEYAYQRTFYATAAIR